VACGTAAYAAEVIRYAIEELARIPVTVDLAHEFRYRQPILNPGTLVIAISQSGETMDTLMAVRHAIESGVPVLSVCNTQGATLARESTATVHTHAGPEVAVASTKALTAQIAAGYLIALRLAATRNPLQSELNAIGRELLTIPRKIERVLNSLKPIRDLAQALSNARSVLFLGRSVGFPIAMEGALKLKELAYIHAEGFAAGELKHGPIALIESGQPVLVLVPSPKSSELLHAKVISNIQEIKARGARVIAICETGDAVAANLADVTIELPSTLPLISAILLAVPLQVFALELAQAKGLDVDQPRNLAKSVTVE
jgi:glucosamine--fructose-6-phosphate aminotransferase (isomerizing)